jgi:hypothetical protein
MDARAALYGQVATLTVDTDELSVDETVAAILAGLELTPETTRSAADD